MRHRVWAIGWALGGVLWATQARAQCTKDTDCKGERVCEQGQCVNPAPAEALPPPPPPPPAATPAEPAPTTAAAATPTAATPTAPSAPLVDDEQAPQTYHRRSGAMMTTGIVLTSASLPFLLVAAALSSAAYHDCIGDAAYEYRVSGGTVNGCQESLQTRGYAILGGTLVMLGVGIPLIIYGAKKVPDNAPQAVLVPWASPTAGGATLRLAL